MTALVKLNVGGTRFWTTRETLLWLPDTFFAKLLSDDFGRVIDEEGAVFIDRDPAPFRYVLAFMRSMRLNVEDVTGVSLGALRDEAEFYGVAPLVDKLSFYLAANDAGCGGLLFSGALSPGKEHAAGDAAIRCIAADHNWVVVAVGRRVVCYSFVESFGWMQRFVSPSVPAGVDRLAINNKFGEQGSKMVAVAYGSTARLFAASSSGGSAETGRGAETRQSLSSPDLLQGVMPGQGLSGTLQRRQAASGDTFDLGQPIDSMFFIGSTLVTAAWSGRVGVWNWVSKTWQAQDVAPIGCLDHAGSLLFLGSTTGSISYIDMEKFPLRLKDDALLVNDFWHDPRGDHITALSVFMTGQVGDENCIEIAYGTTSGTIRIIIHHPQSGSHYPVLFQTYTVHQSPIRSIVLSETTLISVCESEGHARTWRVTRFRGRISTQPGSVPLASFRISPIESVEAVGPLGDRNQVQLFVQRVAQEPARTILLDAATGRKIGMVKSLDPSPITIYFVNESDFPNRVGARSRRFLLCGHESGTVELWDLTTAVELFQQDRAAQDIKKMSRKPTLVVGMDSDVSIELIPSGLTST